MRALSEQMHRDGGTRLIGWGRAMPRPKMPASSFRYFNSWPEIIRLVVMMYVRFRLSLRNVEDLLAERGVDICHETVRHWWNRFGPLFAADVRRQRVSRMKGFRQWKWHLDEAYVTRRAASQHQWRDALPLARSRPGGRGAGGATLPRPATSRQLSPS